MRPCHGWVIAVVGSVSVQSVLDCPSVWIWIHLILLVGFIIDFFIIARSMAYMASGSSLTGLACEIMASLSTLCTGLAHQFLVSIGCCLGHGAQHHSILLFRSQAGGEEAFGSLGTSCGSWQAETSSDSMRCTNCSITTY